MSDNLVSIIVPIYNREKVLSRCIRSILEQSHENIEVILVDDGSKDSSLEVCQQFAKEDKRIKVLHQDNAGVSVARNHGLEESTGEYIAFIDSDDYVDAYYVEKLLLALTRNSCCVSMCNYYSVYGEQKNGPELFLKDETVSTKKLIENILYGRCQAGLCGGKLWKRNFIKQVFKNYGYCEDLLFVIENLSGADDLIALVKEPLYYYVKSEDSITMVRRSEDLMDTLDVAARILRISKTSAVIDAKPAYSLALDYAFFAYLSAGNDQKSGILKRRCLLWIKRLRCYVFWNCASTVKTKGACVLSVISMTLLKKMYSRKKHT